MNLYATYVLILLSVACNRNPSATLHDLPGYVRSALGWIHGARTGTGDDFAAEQQQLQQPTTGPVGNAWLPHRRAHLWTHRNQVDRHATDTSENGISLTRPLENNAEPPTIQFLSPALRASLTGQKMVKLKNDVFGRPLLVIEDIQPEDMELTTTTAPAKATTTTPEEATTTTTPDEATTTITPDEATTTTPDEATKTTTPDEATKTTTPDEVTTATTPDEVTTATMPDEATTTTTASTTTLFAATTTPPTTTTTPTPTTTTPTTTTPPTTTTTAIEVQNTSATTVASVAVPGPHLVPTSTAVRKHVNLFDLKVPGGESATGEELPDVAVFKPKHRLESAQVVPVRTSLGTEATVQIASDTVNRPTTNAAAIGDDTATRGFKPEEDTATLAPTTLPTPTTTIVSAASSRTEGGARRSEALPIVAAKKPQSQLAFDINDLFQTFDD